MRRTPVATGRAGLRGRDGWREEAKDGKKRLRELIEREADHPIERAGARARALMLRHKEDKK